MLSHSIADVELAVLRQEINFKRNRTLNTSGQVVSAVSSTAGKGVGDERRATLAVPSILVNDIHASGSEARSKDSDTPPILDSPVMNGDSRHP